MKASVPLLGSIALLFLGFFTASVQSQEEPPAYREIVAENPAPEEDLQVVSDYIAAIESADIDRMSDLLADDVAVYGPTNAEGESKEQVIESWTENFENQKDIEYGFVTQTFRVLSGDLAGDWVSTWGDYSYTTADGVKVSFPAHVVSRVENGKIKTLRAYYDRMSTAETLGYTITPPAGSQ